MNLSPSYPALKLYLYPPGAPEQPMVIAAPLPYVYLHKVVSLNDDFDHWSIRIRKTQQKTSENRNTSSKLRLKNYIPELHSNFPDQIQKPTAKNHKNRKPQKLPEPKNRSYLTQKSKLEIESTVLIKYIAW